MSTLTDSDLCWMSASRTAFESRCALNVIKNVFNLEQKVFNDSFELSFTTRILEMLGRFLNLNKMKTKRLSNHMSQYFIHNRT